MPARRSRLHVTLAVLVVATGTTAQVAAAPGPSAGAALEFRPPVVAIPAETNQTEPQVLVTPGGTVLVASQYQRGDCQSGQPRVAGSRACVWRSTDGGKSFSRSGGGQNTAADVHFARMPSGVLLYTTLANPEPGTFTSGIGGATILRSLDDGKTWSSTILNGLSPIIDRPFLTVLGGSTVLLTYTALPGNLFASRSTDDGKTFGPAMPITAVPEQVEFTRPGGPALDRSRGEILQPYYAGTSEDPALNNESFSGMVDLKVTRSADGGMTWADEVVAPRVRPILGVPSIAADDQGREFMVWSARDEAGHVDAYFSRNLKPGAPWTAPVPLGKTDHSGYLAWAVARGDGGVAVGYVGSDHPDAATEARPWTIRIAVSQNAGDSWTIHNASRHTVYTGPQNRSISVFYDLIGLVLDQEGFLHLTYPRRVGKDGVQLNQVEYTRQVTGPALGTRGKPSSGARPARPHPEQSQSGPPGTTGPAPGSLPATGAAAAAAWLAVMTALAGLLLHRWASSPRRADARSSGLHRMR
jgi:hypothetical protein